MIALVIRAGRAKWLPTQTVSPEVQLAGPEGAAVSKTLPEVPHAVSVCMRQPEYARKGDSSHQLMRRRNY